MTPLLSRRSGPRTPLRKAIALLAAISVLAAVPSLVAGADDQLKQTREELRETKERIRARAKKLRVLQKELNALATEIALNEAQIHQADDAIEVLLEGLGELEKRNLRLRAQLDERNREAFILGPAAPVLYLLTATSAAEAASRLSFLGEMNRRDGVLAREVARTKERLSRDRSQLVRLQRARELTLQQLAIDRAALREKLATSRRLFSLLQERHLSIRYEISRIRPFAVCPVQGPRAIANDFGIWVRHPEDEGGDHIHQGNDLSTPLGTPLVAVFDGTAVTAANKIGGLAVKVYGDFGYAYYAHLSRYGKLGQVQKGDVIGYAGATGNASGSHLHFEWHPANGSAIDPHPFLLKVC